MKQSLFLSICLAYFASVAHSETKTVETKSVDSPSVEADDSRIHYSGRWERSDPLAPWCCWQGSAMTVKFRGTAIRATISATKPDAIRVIVDGDTQHSTRHQLTEGRQSYELASELSPGEHTVQLVKETYSQRGRMTFHGFDVTGRDLVEFSPPEPRLRIEFYGDSNLAGSSLGHEKDKGGLATDGCFNSFAGITARMLDAEYHNISVGGAITAGKLNSVLSFHNRIDFYEERPRWDFARFPADVCVVNIGANDIGRKSKAQIVLDFNRVLAAIRAAHPKAHIVVMNAYGWSRDEPANYTRQIVTDLGDDNMSCLRFPWLFNEWHGCEYDHAGMAVSLVAHLGTINPAWKAVRPADVMDGFGRQGDVANGSFEHVAPFGGYGWRYFQDGAERIHDPHNSADGSWFLRLPAGKQVHQPTPTSAGRHHTYQLKLRSVEAGSEAHVRIEFRDQNWRHEIPKTAQDISIQPHTDWQVYTIDVTSPAAQNPPNPSHDPWKILIRIACKSGTIDCDDVKLTTPNIQARSEVNSSGLPAR